MKRIFFFLVLINISFPQQLHKVTDACDGVTTVTYEGKTYNTVAIGEQCWLKENLDVGTMIDSMQNATNNGMVEKYCYRNEPNNCETYGGLYPWDEAMQYTRTPGAQGICPSGWHIPSNDEFNTLCAYVGWNGNALKAVGQGSGGGAGTNTSGFSALLAGSHYANGGFTNLGIVTSFWSSKESNMYSALFLQLSGASSDVDLVDRFKPEGFSIRCLKDTSTTGINDLETPSSDFILYQNYPNPFNPSTTISFKIPNEEKVKLAVYDLMGREIKTLVDDNLSAGQYQIEFNAQDLPSGVYFYKLSAGNYTESKKLEVLK